MKTMSKIIVSPMDFANGKRLCIMRFYKTRVISIDISQGKDIPTNYDHGILKAKKFLITIKIFIVKELNILNILFLFILYDMIRLCYVTRKE